MSRLLSRLKNLLVVTLRELHSLTVTVLIVNEEGKLKGLPLNPEATAYVKMQRSTMIIILQVVKTVVVGPAILIKANAL